MEKVSSVDSPELSPHIASLIKSLTVVPPTAVPAIIDCVLASSDISPSHLFSSLLHSLPDPSQAPQSNCILSHASAICYLIKNTEDHTDALRLLIWKVFVPILKVIETKDLELVNEVEGLLLGAVSKMDSQEILEETLVPYCLRSVGVSVGMIQNDAVAIYEWSTEDLLVPGALPLPIACRILTSLLDPWLTSLTQIQREQKLEGFAANLLWDLSNLALGMLMRSINDRSFSIRMLLPTLFKLINFFSPVEVFVHGTPYVLSRLSFAKKIWKCCMSLFSLGHLERLDSYYVLSLYLSSFCNGELHGNFARANICKESDLRYKKEFWDEIRRGLVDKDSSLRKKALHILKVSLHDHSSHIHYSDHYSSGNSKMIAANDHTISCNGTSLHANITKRSKWAEEEAKSLGVGEVCHLGNGYLNSHERWKVFLLLYEMLEEYGTHLVEAAWTHQVSLLFQSWTLKDYTSDVSRHVYLVQMETIEGIVSWLAVLWERGFFHENPQVRCLILQSFLSIDWAKYETCAHKVPRSFVLGPLVLGLNDVVHHNDFGVKGIYTSRTIQSATNFFGEYSRQLSTSARKYLVWGLASVAKQEAFGRAGLMTLAFCIASSACQFDKYSLDEKHDNLPTPFELQYEEISQEVLWLSRSSDLLEVLGIIIERSKQHFNPNYRLQVCEQVLKAASSLIDINSVSLDVLLHFLAAVPREFTDCAGSLRQTIQEWLTQCNVQCQGFGSSDTEELLLKDLYSFPVSFLKDKYPPNDSITFDDEDADSWRLEAERWARVLFLVIRKAQHLEPVVMFLWNYFSTLCKQDCSMNQVAPFKTILLILSLVEELQVEWRKSAGYGDTNVGRGYSRARKLDRSSLLVNFFECEKFVVLFSSIMEELSSFSRLFSPIFWEVSMKVVPQLPCSIKGKLGGPSQRRLASETTSCLLQAIMSVRALACISSLFVQLKRSDHCDSSFAYLWDFSWRVIHNQTYNTETAAELCLAGYEALAYVYKAWSTHFSTSSFDFILSYNISHFPDGENIPLLDPMLLRFLQNINNLLANGVLTRSRRAVLMNWKWHCLDSLLSISSNDLQNGNANRLFSDSTLRITFSDIVESLENAGEISVLYILRSVRVVITLLYAVNTSETLFSGVTSQMMQKLVNSSWILHISCNKRRVASIAALLSAVLHQSVFSDLRMHETNDSRQGPFKWFIGKLLDEGTKSPRTIRLAALHLTGLWLLYPQTVKYYIKELKLLCLYGSVAFDEDFESELLENHDARSEVALLAQSPDRELTEVFINTELYARVSVAVLFCKLGSLADSNAQEENEVFLAALECGKLFLLELLDSAVNDEDIAKELYKKYSAVHRRKVRAWQMICVLSKFVDDDIVLNVTSNLHICLYRNNLPAVRQYLETFAIQVYLKFPSLAEEQLIPIFCNYNMRPQALSSYVFIATNVILHASPVPVQIQHLNELLPPLVPFLTSHHHSLRGFTQLLVHYVLCKLWPFLVPDSSELAPLEKRCFENLKNYLAQNADCARLRASMEGFLDIFDPNTSATPAGVFSPRNEGSEFECVPISLMEQVITFLNNVRDDLRNSIAKEVVTIENERMTILDAWKETVEVPNASTNGGSPQTSNDLSLDFQKKITIYERSRQAEGSKSNWLLENSEISRFLLELEKEDQLLNPVLQSRNQAMARIKESQQQFILVASLIDRIPNLAGLARTCEVFKAAALVVSDASIMQDKQFQLISVTAEKWVPIIEVPVNSMKVFLEKKRREGFSILGLEQTANSTPLDKFSFPIKTVLVLGREKEGIPVEIIHILDACIEIPQLGIIRSLNVHVSGAIALWEYTRQQRYKQS